MPESGSPAHLSPERERALLECYRLIYRAELVADTLDLGCSDDLGDLPGVSPSRAHQILPGALVADATGLHEALGGDVLAVALFPLASTALGASTGERLLLRLAHREKRLARWDEARGEYAEELGRLYRAYRERLERLGRRDETLHRAAALDAIREDPSRWGATPVLRKPALRMRSERNSPCLNGFPARCWTPTRFMPRTSSCSTAPDCAG